MAENVLVDQSKEFAVKIIAACDVLYERGKATPIINQLLRSGTSIGANIHEANYASSRADFVNKLQIALKESYETDYLLAIFHESGLFSDEEHKALSSRNNRIRKLLTSSITTAKKSLE